MRSLPDMAQKIKGILSFYEGDISTTLHVLLLLGVGVGAYTLGQINGPVDGQGGGVRVFSQGVSTLPNSVLATNTLQQEPSSTNVLNTLTGKFVASKKGTKYHRTDCPGAQTMKDENKLYFQTEEEARAAGFVPAGNCPGLSQ